MRTLPHASNPAPPWISALIQGVETYQQTLSDPATWIPLIERRAQAQAMFQAFADYFQSATTEIATSLETHHPDHIFGIRMRSSHVEIHGWIDFPNPLRPNSVPQLCIEVGDRVLNDSPVTLWETTVSDSQIPIDFAPAVAAWNDWLNHQAPLPLPSASVRPPEHRHSIFWRIQYDEYYIDMLNSWFLILGGVFVALLILIRHASH